MDTPRQIAQCRAQLAALEKQLAAELAELPARFGFAGAEEFVAAVRNASLRKGGQPQKQQPITASTGFKKRARVTPEMVAKVKTMVEAKATGRKIAAAIGVSMATVQNLKHKLGLAKRRPRK